MHLQFCFAKEYIGMAQGGTDLQCCFVKEYIGSGQGPKQEGWGGGGGGRGGIICRHFFAPFKGGEAPKSNG